MEAIESENILEQSNVVSGDEEIASLDKTPFTENESQGQLETRTPAFNLDNPILLTSRAGSSSVPSTLCISSSDTASNLILCSTRNVETLICILHLKSSNVCEDVKLFDDTKWKKVLNCLDLRKSKKNWQTSKYGDILNSIPATLEPSHGYHRTCYSNFTAMPLTQTKVSKSVSQPKRLRSSRQDLSQVQSTSSIVRIFLKLCLFCDKEGKGKEPLSGILTIKAATLINSDAIALNDNILLGRISGIDLLAKEARYHRSCRSKYRMAALRRSGKNSLDEESIDEIGKTNAWSNMCLYVESSIIKNNRMEFLPSLYQQYLLFCEESDEIPFQSTQYLQTKLQSHFGGRIKFSSPSDKKAGTVVYNSEISFNALSTVYDSQTIPDGIIKKAAMLLRQELKGCEPTKITKSCTLSDLCDLEDSRPELTLQFFRTLYGGPNGQYSDDIDRRAKSACDDAVFNVSHGRVKPLKHMALGVSVKSLTGSKKLVTVLNRLGHGINYSTIEELETEAAIATLDMKTSCPSEAIENSPMGLSFDNYDELTHTLSGSETLHDTNAIMYQNIPLNRPNQRNILIHDAYKTKKQKKAADEEGTTASTPKRPRRTIDNTETILEPYCGIPKVKSFDYTQDIWKLPDRINDSITKNSLWLTCHATLPESTPMWVGFQSQFHTDALPKQKVMYMPNLNKPITRFDVIQETLKITQNCAEECGQKYGVVTYDLAVAKPAVQIQITETPRFDNIFIMYGPFHIELCFFRALGKFCTEAGGIEMLTECGVLAGGSLNGIISGKNFNRCKRLHTILALAFESLHFDQFLSMYEGGGAFKDLMTFMIPDVTQVDLQSIEQNETFNTTLEAYKKFQDTTRNGEHGPTAQFWFTYVDYVNHLHHFDRAIRTNDIDMFINVLTKLIDLFFATNQHNYAKWLTKYQLDLAHIDTTHPGLKEILEAGAFTVRRTDKSFSRLPIDLTVEQTVNCDSASRLTGISAMTNNFAARLRFMITKSGRSTMVNALMKMAGINTIEDATTELSPARIARDNSDLKKVVDQIKTSGNPFDGNAPTTLFNISTGKCATDEIKNFLLQVPRTGENLHKKFIEGCQEDPSQFEKPLKRVKLQTFAELGAQNKRSSDPKIAALKCSANLMGRLVVLSTKKDLDLEYILTYPLTPVPLTMCNPDGTLVKTAKSVLFQKLEGKLQSSQPPKPVHSAIIDGNFIVHTQANYFPKTYEGVARSFLTHVTSYSADSIHVVFDKYDEPSIKTLERQRRGENAREFVITGPTQNRPSDFNEALKSPSFKRNLPRFFIEEWKKDYYCSILGTRQLYLNMDHMCICYFVENNSMKTRDVPELASNHNEADTKICLHTIYCCKNTLTRNNIVIRATDTDIAVIMLFHSGKFERSIVWMQLGMTSKNTLRYVNLNELALQIGPSMCAALPGLHAYTGSDYTSAFVRKGKARPFTTVETSKEFQQVLQTLSTDQPNTKGLEKFTCKMYGGKSKNEDINKLRYETFLRMFGPSSSAKQPFEKIKGMDPKMLPPCRAELLTHIARSSFVTKMWANADKAELPAPTKTDGWDIGPESIQIIWHKGMQVPADLVPSLPEPGDDESESGDELEAETDDDDDEFL